MSEQGAGATRSDSVLERAEEESSSSALTRRGFLRKGAATAATVGVVGGLAGSAGSATAAGKNKRKAPGFGREIPLPSAQRVRADYQTMLDFGPRLPGSEEHHEFCDWIEDEFVDAGLELRPSDRIRYRSWQPGDMTLRVGSETFIPPAPFVRAPGTHPEGVSGPLALDGDGSPVDGSVLVIEPPVPVPGGTAAPFAHMAEYLHWDGHTTADVAAEEFRRMALSPWPVSLQNHADNGVKAVIVIADVPREELEGNWSPHQSPVQPLPAVVVDRDLGAQLKALASGHPTANLKSEAYFEDSHVSCITGILPGKSDEVVIVNSHTDGNNVFEENGAVALVHMARHFASLRGARKLDRTLVFVAWSGHYADVRNLPEDPNTLPEQYGWIPVHRDLFDRTVAAVTMEHLGAVRWADTPDGYRSMDENEFYAIWTSFGPIQDLGKAALIQSNLQRHLIMKPPEQVTPGIAWHWNGIPHVSGLGAPTYLLQDADTGGGMDKLDAGLAARQTAFYADVVRRLDTADPDALLTAGDNDPSFGSRSIRDVWKEKTQRARSGPQRKVVFDAGNGRRLAVYVGGRRARRRDIEVHVAALDRPLRGIVVELYRGQTLFGRSVPVMARRKARRLAVHRRGHRRDHRNLRRNRRAPWFRNGNYTVVARQGRRVLGRRNVRFVGQRG